jgi:glycosyltransferase involved in cell wall biosynthesis
LLSVSRSRDLLAVAVPVYFSSEVPRRTIEIILSGLLEDSDLFCRRDRLLAVVDGDTTAEEVLSGFEGLRVHRLERNRGKAGAVAAALRVLLDTTDAEFIATRDCDGDHAQEDLPRLVGMAADVMGRTGRDGVAAIGSRPSLSKPMGWLRSQWEWLTNRILLDLLDFASAREDWIVDRRFWSADVPDIQSGYRVYSRRAAEWAVESLNRVPEDRNLLTFACEFVPFADLTMAGGVFGQVLRQTLVEQPVTSYGGVDLAAVYADLLLYVAGELDVSRAALLGIFDNRLAASPLLFTDHRGELARARKILAPDAEPLPLPGFL